MLRGRISRLSAAILRINASLDLDTVLHEVVESARALTRRLARRDHDRRRRGPAAGLRHLRLHRRRATADGGLARRAAAVQTPVRPSGDAEAAEFRRLRALARLLPGPHAVDDVPGNADAPSGRARRQLLPRREGKRRGVHGRGRRGPGAVRVAGGGGDRQRPHAPRRAAGARGPGGPDRNLPGRRRGLRSRHRPFGVAQSRGEADRGEPAHAGPHGGAAAGSGDLPARRRARNLAQRVPADAGAEQRRDGARRGDRTLSARRAHCHDADQRHADPLRRRRGRVVGRHHAGSGAAPRAGAVAGGVSRHGEPRAAGRR